MLIEFMRAFDSSDHVTTRGGAISKSTAISPRLSRKTRTLLLGGSSHGVGPTRQTCLSVDSL